MSNALTTRERDRLEHLEGVVRRGQQTFIEVGNALAEIRDSRLYKETHGTFESYCRDKWNWSRVQAHHFIKAADTAERLLTNVNTPAPTSEGQIRPLTGDYLTSDEKYQAWVKAHEIAEEEETGVTGAVVQRAVDQVKPKSTVKISDVDRAVNESNADKAIAWVNEIDMTKAGARDALQKVVKHCNKLLKGAES